ncbi:DeoR/GlpR family DNA-binding transcription regulator [Caenimonas aquaedulcis]|uniref:DeoR/GlpR transcriptional regulator n=1 Tax=Caenimonas aquaedulcis TaxID=2793270 RepID=A0A931H8G4_9BURK|nr:DeoR/GlpR family DNA-binding transcription regulator [Caenimonas aquaedulcis]MBG9390463.1 DeoR/GlpR transcriptional regulator [Caenimonas aquaedulcis]
MTTKHPVAERLLPRQRQSFILDVLTESGAASLQQLAERLGASFSTVRRDLDELASRKLVERTHGGAILGTLSKTHVETDDTRAVSGAMKDGKVSIGRIAASRVSEGNSVIFDSSTTVLEAARALVESRLRFTAVTNNIKIADVLSASDHVRLIVPGGTRRTGTNLLSGEPGDTFFSQLHADIALIGAQSASDGMLTDSRLESASSKRLLMKAAKTRLLLIDSWKFGGPGFCNVVPLSDFDEIITDQGLADDEKRELERRKIAVSIDTPSVRTNATRK